MAKKTIKYNSASLRWELLDASSTVISYATGNPTDNPWELTGWKTTSGSLTLTAGGTVDATALSSHILYGETAYARGRKLTGTIVDAKITTTDTAITVSPGYVGTEVVCPISGGSSVGISYGYINSDGLFQELDLSGNGPVPVGEPEAVDNVVFSIPVDEPTYGETTTAGTSDIRSGKTAVLNGILTTGSMAEANISVVGNVVTITAGYSDGAEHTIGEALPAMEYTIGATDIVIPAGKFLTGPQTIKAMDIPEYPEATVTTNDNQVVITDGIITSQTITVGEALAANSYTVSTSDIVIPAGKYLTGAQTIKAPSTAQVTKNGNVVSITAGLVAKQDVTVGTALARKEYTPGTSSITIPAGSYLTGDQIIKAVSQGYVYREGNMVYVSEGYVQNDQFEVGTALFQTVYTPSTQDQFISPGQYIMDTQIILGDTNLIPENIKKGVTIFGVTGTYEGEGGSDVVATAEDLVVSDCGVTSFNGVYKIQTPGSTGTDRVWIHTSGNSKIYWSGGFWAWHLCEVPNDNGDENDFINYSEDPTGSWSHYMGQGINPPTVKYGGGGSEDSSSSSGSGGTNISVTGAGTSAVNGTYKLQSGNVDDYTGRWSNGTYTLAYGAGYWCITTALDSLTNSPWSHEYFYDGTSTDPTTGPWYTGNGSDPAPTLEWAGSGGSGDSSDDSSSDGGGGSAVSVDYTKVSQFKFAGFSPAVDGDGFESVFMASTYYRRTDLGNSYIWADSADYGYNKNMNWNASGSRWEISMSGPGTVWYTTESNPFTAKSWKHYGGSTVTISFKDIVTDESKPCFVAGTQITLADGTTKAVEDITYEDELLVYNFDEGTLDTAKPAWIKQEQESEAYFVNTFSDGTVLNTVGAEGGDKAHRMFSKEKSEFAYMSECIGDTAYTLTGEHTLVSVDKVNEPCKFYNIITKKHFNLFANGVLTSNRFSNMYPIEDMRYIKTAKVAQEYPGIPEDMVNDFRLAEQNVDIEYLNRLISLKK